MAARAWKLIEDPNGMMFEYLHLDEAEFLYEEVFVRRAYFRHGITAKEGAVVVDAGANIGLFSMQCLREVKGVQVYAFEPIPDIYSVLVRNLHHTSSEGVEIGTSPKSVPLRLALGAEQAEEEFYFFDKTPGESTRHLEERKRQQRVLDVDLGAASWKKAIVEPPTCSPQLDPIIQQPTTKSQRDDAAETRLDKKQKQQGHDARVDEPQGGDGAIAAEGTCHNGHQGEQGKSFVCQMVPLSLALNQLEIPVVDLLKVDVEGDELAVLHGIDDEDWPKINQIVLEVHDLDGRLAATVDLLKSEPAAFDEICWEPQLTSEVRGYVMVVPEALKLFHVFAKRRKLQLASSSTMDKGSTVQRENGSGTEGGGHAHAALHGDQTAESRLSPGVSGGGGNGNIPKTVGGVMLPRFCSCAAVDHR